MSTKSAPIDATGDSDSRSNTPTPETIAAIGLALLLRSREDAGLCGRIRHVEITNAGWPTTEDGS